MTTTRTVKIPDATHPITIEPTGGRVLVRANGDVIADSTRALSLSEASYPAVQYIPLADVDARVLRPSSTESYCPFKGDAHYYSIATPGVEITDAVWGYDQPYDAVAPIAGHVAFYPSKVEIEVVEQS